MPPETSVTPTAAVSDRTRGYLAASKAPATVRAYRSDLRDFEAWCADNVRAPVPAAPETVADYISDLAGAHKSAATITRRLSAISQAHQMAGHESPTRTQLVRMTAAGVRRTLGTAAHQARPVLIDDLRLMVASLADDLRGRRDRALLLIGFGGGFRRSELVALDVEDVIEEAEGLRIHIRRSKTDQEGGGRDIAIVRGRIPLTDAVTALADWLQATGITEGPIFRGVDRAGLDPDSLSGHSLRAGCVTAAAAAGAPERVIMRTTGHRSEAMVRRYIRAGSVFSESASRYLRGM